MAPPQPVVPDLNAAKIPTGPWTPALTKLWALLLPFFKSLAENVRLGVPVSRSMDLEIEASQTYPTKEFASPLPEPYVVNDVVVSNVTDPANPTKSPGLTGGVTVAWTLGPSGGIIVLACTGLPSGARRTVRVVVLGA